MVTREERMNAYRNASGAIADVYGSMETAELLWKIREKYSIPKGVFIDHVGDTILKLKSRSTFEQGLVSEVGLTTDTARAVALELKEFFDKIPNENAGIPAANLEVRDPLELRPAGAAVEAKAAEEKNAAAKPLTREELMNALAGKRTMASDIEAVRKAREEAKKE